MRSSRLKVKGQSAVYHCVTRVVGGAMLLDKTAKEVLRKQIRYMASFCGVEILTYCVMTNHFHVLVRVPHEQIPKDAELVERFRLLYGKDKGKVETLEALLNKGGEEAEIERKKLVARMGDVSLFMKELKQRFSIWYNKSHQRYGTLWAERFKSVLIEDTAACLRTVAAYIDLNPVRAGLAKDPKDYRYCGYSEAVTGNAEAQAGLCRVLNVKTTKTALSEYRKILFLMGSTTSQQGQKAMDREAVKKVVEQDGELPMAQVLRLKIRYFTDGMVLGSKEYVNQIFESHPKMFSERRKSGARQMRGLKNSGFMVARDLRKEVFT
ncbi:MAG: transposase [Verrucomicrobia bacterium]|nr:transposase [Verrucomicrobiota bacterium]MDA1066070.1 transposase [Verrucomicrobiota bacterium]